MRTSALLLAASLLAGPAFAGPEAESRPVTRWEQAPDTAPRPEVEDPEGGWRTEIGLYADVHGDWSDQAVLLRLANHAAVSIPQLAERLGVRPSGPIDVYVLSSEADFQRLQPGRTPDWADGTAWPNHGLIFLKTPSIRPGNADPLEQVLDHELVHILLGQAFDGRPVPRWFQEGMAQFYSGEATFEKAIALARNDFGLEPLPLANITGGFPPDPARAQLAYAQSADFIAWLHARGGDASLRTLVRELAAGTPLGVATTLATCCPLPIRTSTGTPGAKPKSPTSSASPPACQPSVADRLVIPGPRYTNPRCASVCSLPKRSSTLTGPGAACAGATVVTIVWPPTVKR